MKKPLTSPIRYVGTYNNLNDAPCKDGNLAIMNGKEYLYIGTTWEDISYTIEPVAANSITATINYRVKVTHCPDCGAPVKLHKDYCPWCGSPYPKEAI